MNDVFLVLLETSGNQSYIYATNKLRDVIGASCLTTRVGMELVDEAVEEVFKRNFVENGEPQITQEESKGVEVVVRSSGKAMLLIRNKDKAKDFISKWSELVLCEAPGVDATGVISSKSVFIGQEEAGAKAPEGMFCLEEAIGDVHRKFEGARAMRISPAARFQRLPVVAPCAYSTYPASHIWKDQNSIYYGDLLSEITFAKWKCLKKAGERFEKIYKLKEEIGEGKEFVDYLHEIQKKFDAGWVGIVHADGNGLGRIFLNFSKFIEKKNGTGGYFRTYVKTYREFSKELEEATCEAFVEARAEVFAESERPLPILPIVGGGDDLTIAIDGQKAIEFAEVYIKKFVKITKKKPTIRAISKHGLGICAGISIAKAHFPFFTSYDLAEELIRSAKEVKKEVALNACALDFHILYDSSARTIEEIREKLKIDGANLTGKPFAIEVSEKNEWASKHDLDLWKEAVAALGTRNSKDENKAALPNSQAHRVRECMFNQTVDTQEAEWKTLLKKYEDFGEVWKAVEKQASLYLGKEEKYTYFLDALEARGFFMKKSEGKK